MKSMVLPVIAIVVVSALLGLGFNAVRPKDHIRLTRNYFEIYRGPASSSDDATPGAVAGPSAGGGQVVPSDARGGLIHNPFLAVTLDEVIEFYQRSEYQTGDIVFVDARNDEHYEKGHIPGAIHIDRYNSDKYYQAAKDALELADVIVVYCGGGECEDSIFLATEFAQERGVGYDKIRVFEGGMEAWEGDNLETESEDDS